MGKVVGIIGAGISGLLACKYTRAKGFDPIVFESQTSVGGVWSKTLETTKLQTPKGLYQFSDFPWDPSVSEEFPDHNKVLCYIQAYAHKFELMKYIKFNSKVLRISFEGGDEDGVGEKWVPWGGIQGSPSISTHGKWKIFVEDMVQLSTKVYEVDFVILCIGRFSGEANIPEFPQDKGPDVFDGKVMHSIDYSALDYQDAVDLVKGKRVTVVGIQKSGMDIAMECSNVNGAEYPCTVICRSPQWHFTDYYPWGFPLAYLYLNRFAELMLHKPGDGLLLSLLATILSPLRWAFSKFVESGIKHKLQLKKHGMVPRHSFQQSLHSCTIAIVPDGFYDNVDKGSIVIKKSPTFCFNKEGLLLEGDPKPLKTDLVIFATGFNGQKKLGDIFASSKFRDYITGSSDKALPLYRECIHPRIPQLAVVGFSESIANLYTSEMRCRWLAELLDGKFELPSVQKMEEDVVKCGEFMKRYSGKYYGRSCIGGMHIWYNDQLSKDMGWKPKRKKGLLAELFQPYGPLDYAQI